MSLLTTNFLNTVQIGTKAPDATVVTPDGRDFSPTTRQRQETPVLGVSSNGSGLVIVNVNFDEHGNVEYVRFGSVPLSADEHCPVQDAPSQPQASPSKPPIRNQEEYIQSPVKRHGVFLSSQPSSPVKQANFIPIRVKPITLVDPGPVPSPSASPTRPGGFQRMQTSPAWDARPNIRPPSPTTPTRHRSAKELIHHFESSATTPKALDMETSISTPTRSPLSKARLNSPLPALPSRDAKISPSRSPIRNLINMVGFRRKAKRNSNNSGERTKSVSPTPKRRALLAEDDDTTIVERSLQRQYGELDITNRGSQETVRGEATNPSTNAPSNGPKPGVEDHTPILRAGPLLYAVPPTRGPEPFSWTNTQATLKPPTLSLSTPRPLPGSMIPPRSPFRIFNLRHATVESLPSTVIDNNVALDLGITGVTPLNDPSGLTIYVFEVTIPSISPDGRSISEGAKERFATTSPWDRGKWVCHVWDAICAANEGSGTSSTTESACGAASSDGHPEKSSLSSCSAYQDNPMSNSGDADSDGDPCTHRLQPPLRVVNVSKLSAFYDADSVKSKRSWAVPSITAGSSAQPQSSNSSFGRTSTPLSSSSVDERSTTSREDAQVKPPALSVHLTEGALQGLSAPPRSAPLTAPYSYGTPSPSGMADSEARAIKTRSRSVPCSPSVGQLGRLSLVQQRLARFESVREGIGPSLALHERSEALHEPPAEASTGDVASTSATGSNEVAVNTGLNTPPTSPLKATLRPQLLHTETARDAYMRPAVSATSSGIRSVPPSPIKARFDPPAPVGSVQPAKSGDDAAQKKEPEARSAEVFPKGNPVGSSNEVVELKPSDSTMVRYGNIASRHLDIPEARQGTPRLSSRWSDTTAASEDATSDRPAPTTLANNHSDVTELLTLIRTTASEQTAQVTSLVDRLEGLREEVKAVHGSADVEQRLVAIGEQLEGNLRNIPAASSEGNIRAEDVDEKFKALHSQLDAAVEAIKAALPEPPVVPTTDLTHAHAQLDEIRSTDLPKHLEVLSLIQAKVNTLEKVDTTLAALNEAACADRTAWTQRLDDIAGSMGGIDLNTINDRLDGMRASLAVLEAVAKSQQSPPVPPPRMSVFRNASTAAAKESAPAVDLSSLHEKLDALASTRDASSGPDVEGIKEKVDSLVALCQELASKFEGISQPQAVKPEETAEGGGEKPKAPDFAELLEHLKEDQTERERYYTDLNGWLESNATQTGTQYHAIATQLQHLSQALAPMAPLPVADNVQGEADGDKPETGVKDAGTSEQPAAPPRGTILQDIRQALVENNNRNRTNDNFLAAANHLIGAANAERQNLVTMIAAEREENVRLLSQFAERITMEIRGQKHSFVDAMEKATALNVEGQLRELKTQISGQLFEMAKGVERLLEERKVLEHQIAELLTFKSRFANTNGVYLPVPAPGSPQGPTYAPIAPQPPAHRLSIQASPTQRYPDHLHPGPDPLPPSAAEETNARRPLPTPSPGPRRQLPVPQISHRM
ncbi:hypothetical protein FRB99_003835 [Tulasnella sp. 403]|nr:hypothetical protein FRB99_003835 [Tulasnella sp. 403]